MDTYSSIHRQIDIETPRRKLVDVSSIVKGIINLMLKLSRLSYWVCRHRIISRPDIYIWATPSLLLKFNFYIFKSK